MAPAVVEQLLGSFVVGCFLAVFLGGIVASLGFTYYSTALRTDRRSNRVLVALLIIVDMFHSATCVSSTYEMTIESFMEPLRLARCPWTFWIQIVTTGFATTLCQSFYAYKIYIVGGRRRLVPSLIMLLSLAQLGFTVAGSVGIKVGLDSLFSRFHERTYGVLVWLISAAVADLLITGSLVYYIHSNTSGLSRRNSKLASRIIRNTIETNGLTLSVAILDAILFVRWQDRAYHLVPNQALVKLYTMSVLVSLNARAQMASVAADGTQSQCSVAFRPPKPTVATRHRRREAVIPVLIHLRELPQADDLKQSPPPSADSSEVSLLPTHAYYPQGDPLPLTCVPSRRHAVPASLQ